MKHGLLAALIEPRSQPARPTWQNGSSILGERWIFQCLAERGSGLLPPDGICQGSALAQRVRVRDRIAGLCVPQYAGSGAAANPVTVAITDVLGSSIGDVRRQIVKGAGNFFIFSYSAE